MARSKSPARASTFGKHRLEEAIEHVDVLLAQQFYAATHVLEALRRRSRSELVAQPSRTTRCGAKEVETACSRARCAELERRLNRGCEMSPRISANRAACNFPNMRVLDMGRTPPSALARRQLSGSRALDLAQSATIVSASMSIVTTPVSKPKRESRSSSRPGWHNGQCPFKIDRAPLRDSPANEQVTPRPRWATPASAESLLPRLRARRSAARILIDGEAHHARSCQPTKP